MSNTPDQQSRKSSIISKVRSFSLVFALGMIAGVLIWAKLRLVTDIPRSAYADPREVDDQSQAPKPNENEGKSDGASDGHGTDPADIKNDDEPQHP